MTAWSMAQMRNTTAMDWNACSRFSFHDRSLRSASDRQQVPLGSSECWLHHSRGRVGRQRTVSAGSCAAAPSSALQTRRPDRASLRSQAPTVTLVRPWLAGAT